MIKRKTIILSDGRSLNFPAHTSDDTIKKVVDRINNEKKDKEKDLYGPAIEKQTEILSKLSKDIIDTSKSFTLEAIKSDNQSNNFALSLFEPVLKQISEHLAATVRVHAHMVEIQNKIIQNMENNNRTLNEMVSLQIQNNDILQKLVDVSSKEKKILRDKSGNIVGVTQGK